MISQNDLNQLSRRKWLRDTAIAATSITVVPSFFIGCSDHRIPPTVGVGAPGVGIGGPANPPTPQQLANAAQNILNMKVWLQALHLQQVDYEGAMLPKLKSGEKDPPGLSDLIINIFIAIVVGILTAAAAAAEVASLGVATAGVVALYAVAAEVVKKFAFGESRPHDLDGVFADFKTGHDKSHYALVDALYILADDTDNYRNLRDKWTKEYEFNGKTHTYQDFAIAGAFPSESKGTAFVALKDAAYRDFKKSFWNVMIAKAGKLENTVYFSFYAKKGDHAGQTPSEFARNHLYKNEVDLASYLRGWYDRFGDRYYYRWWFFTFDGRKMPPDLADELFMDDTPEHIINPNGLFNRDYVYKQFHTEKPDFIDYYDLPNERNWEEGDADSNSYQFNPNPDFEFKGGIIKFK
ncbi:hypothetical protein [Spirosoma arcticum]